MAALKPVGKKSAAPNVRVGPNVRSQLPGVLPAVQGSSGRPMSGSRTFGVRGNNAGPVAVYQVQIHISLSTLRFLTPKNLNHTFLLIAKYLFCFV